MYKGVWKKVIGTFLSLCGLIVSCVPMLIIAILIKKDSQGPVFFKQKRLGKNQKLFTIYKFRTMCNHAYEMGGVVTRSDDTRITKVGAVLRRTSLDELPQMFNIIMGDMAIIGPRPILAEEFEDYKNNTWYCKRYDVLPGMFCTVDINMRASAEREVQFKMDVEYVENIKFWKDVMIFFRIIKTVMVGRNVYKKEIER